MWFEFLESCNMKHLTPFTKSARHGHLASRPRIRNIKKAFAQSETADPFLLRLQSEPQLHDPFLRFNKTKNGMITRN
jgi:hypothetical protein